MGDGSKAEPGFTWVTPQLFVQPRSGGDLRTSRMLQSLCAAADVDVVVVGPADGEHDLRVAHGARSVTVVRRPRSAVAKRVTALRRRWPLQAARAWNPEAAALVASSSERGSVVVIDHPRMLPYVPDPQRPHVLVLHNIEHRLLRSLPSQVGVAGRLSRAWEVAWLRRLELSGARASGASVVVVSEADRQVLEVRCTVVPNGTDLPTDPPSPVPGGPLLFVGSLDYGPNIEALRWWLDAVSPHLPRHLPVLRVVGRGGAAALGALATRQGLEVVGEVESVAPYLETASVVVVPLRSGGGTRLKVLEALAWHRPVVSTSAGVAGLPVQHELHLLVADTPEDMAAAVVRCLSDPALCRRMALAGGELARRHAWPVVCAPFVELALSLADAA